MTASGRAADGRPAIRPSFAVRDVAEARDFYRSVLGLVVDDVPLGVPGADVPSGLEIGDGTGASVFVYPKPDHEPAGFTVLGILVADIERAVEDLAARGVRFERSETEPRTDERGIHRDPRVLPVAWFRDPSGNLLSLNQR